MLEMPCGRGTLSKAEGEQWPGPRFSLKFTEREPDWIPARKRPWRQKMQDWGAEAAKTGDPGGDGEEGPQARVRRCVC